MRFKEYCGYNQEPDKILNIIHKSICEYIIRFIKEQIISTGNPNIIVFNENDLTLKSFKDDFHVLINCYRKKQLVEVKINIKNDIHEILINPKYFKKENTQNYLREFEIDVKDRISNIRKDYFSKISFC